MVAEKVWVAFSVLEPDVERETIRAIAFAEVIAVVGWNSTDLREKVINVIARGDCFGGSNSMKA